MLVHTFNPCNHEAEASCSLSVQGYPGLYLFEEWGWQGTCAPSRSVEVKGYVYRSKFSHFRLRYQIQVVSHAGKCLHPISHHTGSLIYTWTEIL